MAVENRKSKFLLPVWLDLRLGGVFCEQPETMYLQSTDMTSKTYQKGQNSQIQRNLYIRDIMQKQNKPKNRFIQIVTDIVQ